MTRVFFSVTSFGACLNATHSFKVSPGRFLSIGTGRVTGPRCWRNETICP
jgi:hypothetical protein